MQTSNHELVISATKVEDDELITLVEICQKYNIKEDELKEMLEYGLFEMNNDFVSLKTLSRIESAYHLKHDLDINMQGVAMVLELMDELKLLRKEIAFLNKFMD